MTRASTRSFLLWRSRRVRLEPSRGGDDSTVVREEKPRYHAFDALRGMAMFLVIGLHAALGYIRQPIPGVLWCVRDAPTFPAFDWFCWWSMGVSNPLYFTIAGFFAVVLYNSRGLRGFLANRGRRVAVPFVAGIFTVLPACLVAWSWGWILTGRATWREFLRQSFRDPEIRAERIGTAHLWFLEYLIVMLLAYGLIRHWAERRGTPRAGTNLIDRILGSPWRPFFLGIPTTVILWLSRQKVGIDAAFDRHNSFLIDPVKMLHHASFFLVGVGIYRLRHDLTRLARPAFWYLALSCPVFFVRAWLLGHDFVAPLHGLATLGLAFTGALFSWLIVFGAIGAAVRICQGSSSALRYLADSSYWVYLVHMPILGLLQDGLYLLPGHAVIKAPIVLVGTLAIGLGSYHGLVRYSPVGTWLHGRRQKPHAGKV